MRNYNFHTYELQIDPRHDPRNRNNHNAATNDNHGQAATDSRHHHNQHEESKACEDKAMDDGQPLRTRYLKVTYEYDENQIPQLSVFLIENPNQNDGGTPLNFVRRE